MRFFPSHPAPHFVGRGDAGRRGCHIDPMKIKIIAVFGVLSFASAFAPAAFVAEQPADRSSR
jgi:hypothetical protein